jgi:exosortase/archaeosortase family protein
VTDERTPKVCSERSTERAGGVARPRLFAPLFVVGVLNGLAVDVFWSVVSQGYATALWTTCGISIVVWAAVLIAAALVHEASPRTASRLDFAVAAGALATFLLPNSLLSWLGLTALAVYVVATSPPGGALRRGALVFAAITVPLFWSRHLFSLFAPPVLRIDGALVGWVTGLSRSGNVLSLQDGRQMYIAMGCSSLANVSLALLCWTVCSLRRPRTPRPTDLLWCVGACGAVVAVNVARISLIAVYPERYDLLHGAVGSTIASWLSTGLTLGLSLMGTRDASAEKLVDRSRLARPDIGAQGYRSPASHRA